MVLFFQTKYSCTDTFSLSTAISLSNVYGCKPLTATAVTESTYALRLLSRFLYSAMIRSVLVGVKTKQ
eukprot:4765143-Ditylum_brightwellii.AAC.1